MIQHVFFSISHSLNPHNSMAPLFLEGKALYSALLHLTFMTRQMLRRQNKSSPSKLAQILLHRHFLSKACVWSITVTFPGTKNCSGPGKEKLCILALLHIKWWVWLFAIKCRIMSALETCIWVHGSSSYQEQTWFRVCLDDLQWGEQERGMSPFNPGLEVVQEELGVERKTWATCYIIVGETWWWFLNNPSV